jgi:hypothetical protein
MAYQLDDDEKVKSHEGKQIRIAGKLDAKNKRPSHHEYRNAFLAVGHSPKKQAPFFFLVGGRLSRQCVPHVRTGKKKIALRGNAACGDFLFP